MTGYLYRGRPGLDAMNAKIMARREAAGKTEGGHPHGEPPHGTVTKYRKHLRDGETPCAPCRSAVAIQEGMRRERRRD